MLDAENKLKENNIAVQYEKEKAAREAKMAEAEALAQVEAEESKNTIDFSNRGGRRLRRVS